MNCKGASQDIPTIAIDPRLCIGCRACEVACAREHHGISHISIYFVEKLLSFAPLNCRHCSKAPCVTVCPVEACRRTSDGIVYIDPIRCIGCRLCGIVCPFGIPRYEAERKVMVKCDLCIHRLREGKEPVCATTCPTDALTFIPAYSKLASSRREETAVKLVEAALEKDDLSKSITGGA